MQNNVVNKSQSVSLTQLSLQWHTMFKCPPPIGAHSSFLVRAIEWQTQAKQLGGLTASERKVLLGNMQPLDHTSTIGSTLVRVWQGETHQVTVLADGYLYAEQRWKSLSAIARAITGTPWSGPVFFGLKK
jgi:hypothetical protein